MGSLLRSRRQITPMVLCWEALATSVSLFPSLATLRMLQLHSTATLCKFGILLLFSVRKLSNWCYDNCGEQRAKVNYALFFFIFLQLISISMNWVVPTHFTCQINVLMGLLLLLFHLTTSTLAVLKDFLSIAIYICYQNYYFTSSVCHLLQQTFI